MEKLYKSVIPVGYIKTEGNRYFLLSTSPVASQDNWEQGLMRWPVVPVDHNDENVMVDGEWKIGYDAARHLLVSPANCAIEIGYTGRPIMVWTGEQVEVPEEAATTLQPSFPDWMK